MANFGTHLSFAGIGAGIGASILYSVDAVSASEMMLLWLTGTIGGVLPDIDSDNSNAVKLIFGVLCGALCIAALLLLAGVFSILELWLIMAMLAAIVYWVVLPLFTSFTRHRGIFHSLLAALFFWFSTTALASAHFDALLSWTIGFFCFFGFVLHLILDEIYSVDLLNTKIKRSFGTAIKPVSLKYRYATATMLAATILIWNLTPSIDTFKSQYISLQFADRVAEILLPKQGLFGVINFSSVSSEPSVVNDLVPD